MTKNDIKGKNRICKICDLILPVGRIIKTNQGDICIDCLPDIKDDYDDLVTRV